MCLVKVIFTVTLQSCFQLGTLIVVHPKLSIESFQRGAQTIAFHGPSWGKVALPTDNGPRATATHHDAPLPYFDFQDRAAPINVSAQIGRDVGLHCRVSQLGDKTVSWVKKHGQSFELLTFGHLTYSSEERYSLAFDEPNDWRLLIRNVHVKDSGVYECQVSSHPPLARCTNLVVIVPAVEIVDSEGQFVSERFYRLGSTIDLRCSGRPVSTLAPAHLLWMHGTKVLNHDTSRGGISVKTEASWNGVQSSLRVFSARKTDAGVYSCRLGNAQAKVTVHVLSGEHADAMQYGSSATYCGKNYSLLISLYTILNFLKCLFCRFHMDVFIIR